MPTVMPDDELLRKAVCYIDELLKDGDKPLAKILDEAAMRFNLGPASCEYLNSLFSNQKDQEKQ